MASSSGTSSVSSVLPNSGSEGDLQLVLDQRKQKRMLSNRESARRSRMRKQKHLDDLMAQVAQLRKENSQILSSYKHTTQLYSAVESENSVLRTQMMELNTRLQSMNEILHHMSGNSGGFVCDGPLQTTAINDSFFMNPPWSLLSAVNHQPIMASADMFQY